MAGRLNNAQDLVWALGCCTSILDAWEEYSLKESPEIYRPNERMKRDRS